MAEGNHSSTTSGTPGEPDAPALAASNGGDSPRFESSAEYRLTKSFLADEKTTPAIMAQVLDSHCKDAKARNSFNFMALCDGILDNAERSTFEDHSKLAAFVLEWRNLVTNSASSGDTERQHLIADCPLSEWQYYIFDIVLAWGGEDDLDTLSSFGRSGRASHWERFFAFLAQLTEASCAAYGPNAAIEDDSILLDYTGAARWSFLYAFGQPDADVSRVTASEHAVRCACWWLIRASNQLWHNVKTERKWSYTPKRHMPDWHLGFWRLWKESAGRALQNPGYTDDTKRLLKDAIAEMDKHDVEDASAWAGLPQARW